MRTLAFTAIAAPQPTREPETCEFPVQGMTCGACVRRVERALGRVPGVETASVNFVTQRATVDSPDLAPKGAPRGEIFHFEMSSTDSVIFTGEDSTLLPQNRGSFTRSVDV